MDWLRIPLSFILFFLILMGIFNIPQIFQEKLIMAMLVIIDFAFLIVALFPIKK